MPYDPNPAATHNPTTGVVVPVNWLDLLNSNFADIGGAWTAYTPTWTSSGTAPALGNGTLTGAHLTLGKLLFVRIYVLFGSTTTYGTGTYAFALPSGVAAKTGVEQILSGKGFDSSAGLNYVLAAYAASAATTVQAAADAAGVVAATVPVTWAQSDSIVISGSIEIN